MVLDGSGMVFRCQAFLQGVAAHLSASIEYLSAFDPLELKQKLGILM